MLAQLPEFQHPHHVFENVLNHDRTDSWTWTFYNLHTLTYHQYDTLQCWLQMGPVPTDTCPENEEA